MMKRRSHTFDQRTIYQLHILGITIMQDKLIVESRISINAKYRVPTFDRKYKSCVQKSEPYYSKMSGGQGKGGHNNKGRGRGGRSSGLTTNRDSTSRTELSHYTYHDSYVRCPSRRELRETQRLWESKL